MKIQQSVLRAPLVFLLSLLLIENLVIANAIGGYSQAASQQFPSTYSQAASDANIGAAKEHRPNVLDSKMLIENRNLDIKHEATSQKISARSLPAQSYAAANEQGGYAQASELSSQMLMPSESYMTSGQMYSAPAAPMQQAYQMQPFASFLPLSPFSTLNSQYAGQPEMQNFAKQNQTAASTSQPFTNSAYSQPAASSGMNGQMMMMAPDSTGYSQEQMAPAVISEMTYSGASAPIGGQYDFDSQQMGSQTDYFGSGAAFHEPLKTHHRPNTQYNTQTRVGETMQNKPGFSNDPLQPMQAAFDSSPYGFQQLGNQMGSQMGKQSDNQPGSQIGNMIGDSKFMQTQMKWHQRKFNPYPHLKRFRSLAMALNGKTNSGNSGYQQSYGSNSGSEFPGSSGYMFGPGSQMFGSFNGGSSKPYENLFFESASSKPMMADEQMAADGSRSTKLPVFMPDVDLQLFDKMNPHFGMPFPQYPLKK